MKPNIRGDWDLTFGPDLANFYSGRGMKVYKPDGQTLADIVNFLRPNPERQLGGGHRIQIGRVRYAASERSGDDTSTTRVDLDPADLLARRTALFGMSRTGKSNTTKIIAAAVFGLRSHDDAPRVGQLILDPNGEYANDNAQDAGSLRGIAVRTAGAKPDDIVTYGLNPHPNDPSRRIIKLNFFGNEPRDWGNRDQVVEAMAALVQGKEILDNLLSDQTAQYISDFRNHRLVVPEDWDESARTRYMRLIGAYRALLSEHLQPPNPLRRARLSRLTNKDLRAALSGDQKYTTAAMVFGQPDSDWDEARRAWKALGEAINERGQNSVYNVYNNNYASNNNGRDWHDASLKSVLTYLAYPSQGGMRLISRLNEYHSPTTTSDYADDIVADLRAGRLVIVDQSTGGPAGTAFGLDAAYINRNITLRPADAKPHGQDTYFGRKVFYKTAAGEHAVITTAMITAASSDFTRSDLDCYPRLSDMLNVLDQLATYLHRDGFMPLVRAHAHAAIPLKKGADIIRSLFGN